MCSFGQYPNVPGGQSQLTVACTFGFFEASSFQTIEDFPQAVWHNGMGRQLDAQTTAGSNVLIAASPGDFTAADINHPISDPEKLGSTALPPLQPNTFITAVDSPTQVELNKPASFTENGVFVTLDNGTIRSVTDGVTAASSTTLTSATANFVSADVGRIVTGTNLPQYDTIASVTNPTTAVLTTAATASGVGQTLTIGADETTSTARELTDGQATLGSSTWTSASANFQPSDVGMAVSACGFNSADIASVTDSSHAVLTSPAIENRPFSLSDGVTTSGSTTVTTATAEFDPVCDPFQGIAGPGIPAGAYITKVINTNTITISAPATGTASGVSLTELTTRSYIGVHPVGLGPSSTAPDDGEAVSTFETTLAVNPTLVPGAPPCSANEPTGVTVQGQWSSPGSYQGVLLAQAPKFLPNDSIAQILYPSKLVAFAAYVVNVAANTPGEVDTAAHTDIVMPFVPTRLALCGTNKTNSLGIGEVFSFDGATLSQQQLPADEIGRPGSAFVRGIKDLGSGTTTFTGTAYLLNGKGFSPYHGTCTTNFPAAVTDLPCH